MHLLGDWIIRVSVLPGVVFGVLWWGHPMCWHLQSSASFVVAIQEWFFPWRERTGSRSGRGSEDSSRRCGRSSSGVPGRKALARQLKSALCRSLPLAPQKRTPLEEASCSRPVGRTRSGEETPVWAPQEVRHVAWGDARLVKRLARVIGQCAAQSSASIRQACGTWGETKAAYRFFDNARVYPQQVRGDISTPVWSASHRMS